MSAPAPPLIIMRKKPAPHGHHGGAWKVAYADFVTALMALFIVLWLLASDEKIKKAVGSYFSDPTGQGKLMGTTQAGGGEGLQFDKENISKLKERLEDAIKQLPQFEQLKKNVEVTVTREGLRIELLEKESGLFFENGSAKPLPKGTELVRLLGDQLQGIPNKLLIEGHTDAKPYSNDRSYSNWELSADRANSARRVLEQSGVPPTQIAQIRGFADQHLRNHADPLDPANRRISVLVQYIELKSPLQTPAPTSSPVSNSPPH